MSAPGERGVLLPALLLLLAVAAGSYGWVLGLDFTGGDAAPLIDANRFDGAGGPAGFAVQEIRNGIAPQAAFYRPWTGLSYAVDHALHGLRPWGYQLTDLLLHLAASVLVLMLARSLGAPTLAALAAALWFAAHPLGLEVVPAVARRADSWVVVGLLAALWGWRRWEEGLPGGAALVLGGGLVAPLSKETGLLLPLLLLVAARPGRRRRALGLGALLVVPALVGRSLALSGVGGYGGLLFSLRGVAPGLGDLLDPARLGGRWGVRLALPLLLLAALVWGLRGRGAPGRLGRLGLVMTLGLFAPILVADGLAPWYLYGPLAGLALVLAALLSVPRRWVVLPVLLCLVPALASSPLFHHYGEWREASRQARLWRQAVVEVPEAFFAEPVLVAAVPVNVDFLPPRRWRTHSASAVNAVTLRAWGRLLRDRDVEVAPAAEARIVYPAPSWVVQVSRPPVPGLVRLQSFGPALLRRVDRPEGFVYRPAREGLLLADLERPLWRWNGRGLAPLPPAP